jgi:hypothetical protein
MMSKLTPVNRAAARAAGLAAAQAGLARVPAHCETYLSLITGFQIGEGAAQLASDWMAGHNQHWDAIRDAEAAAVLAG